MSRSTTSISHLVKKPETPGRKAGSLCDTVSDNLAYTRKFSISSRYGGFFCDNPGPQGYGTKYKPNSGDFESYNRITLGRWRHNSYHCNLISSSHESRNGRFKRSVFSVKRKVEWEGESINWFIFSKKKNMIFGETSSRFILQSLGLRLPMYIYMPL